MDPLKIKCTECTELFSSTEVLHARNPWHEDGEALSGCPRCYAVNTLVLVCDEPGCTREMTCGWPTPGGGYRGTCGVHMQGATAIEHLEQNTNAAPPQGA